VYSNASSVELFVNGRSLGVKVPDDVKHITWDVPFVHGQNVIEARAGRGRTAVVDRLTIDFAYRPPVLADAAMPFREVAVNVGVKAEVVDGDGVIWEGDRPYRAGSFGFIGGEATQFSKELPVRGTPQTPVYFTYRRGIQGYRFDVPDGAYELELRFAEPTAVAAGERVFDVLVNDRVVVAGLDLFAQAGTGFAVPIVVQAQSVKSGGLHVTFVAKRGDAILSAIRVRAK
jgi:beta-galactosidase